MNYEKLSLANVCNGAAEELFNEELKRVLTNIKDPSTDADKARTVTITFKFTPLKDRSSATVSCACKSTIAPVSPVVAPIVISGEGLAVQGYHANIEQAGLFERPAVAKAQ
jgi:hypothetical protein